MKKTSAALAALVVSLVVIGDVVFGANWVSSVSANTIPRGQSPASGPLNFHAEPQPGGTRLSIVAVNNTPEIAQHLGASVTDGVVIMQVKDKGTKEAGLLRGDIITSIGSQAVANLDALQTLLAQKAPAAVVAVTYIRQGATQTAQVTLAARHEPQRPPKIAPQIMRFLKDLPLERLMSSTSSFEGKDGKLVTVKLYGGTVTAVLPATTTSLGGLTVQPRDGSPAETIALGEGVHLLKQLRPTELAGVQVNDRVVVLRVSVDGQPQQTLALVRALTLGYEGMPKSPQMMPNHRADREGENRRGHQFQMRPGKAPLPTSSGAGVSF
ncbi:MAG: PDZ domain-containing protein [Dehalococcoidia bacterium]|nr:PDZ domain-containing protein [Dehalococcoidia bacterium]